MRDKFLNTLTILALACAAALVLLALLHAPMVLIVAAWLIWPIAAVVLVVQLATSQRLPRRTQPPPVVHEDGSFEVQP